MGGQLQVTVVQARHLARKDLLCMYLLASLSPLIAHHSPSRLLTHPFLIIRLLSHRSPPFLSSRTTNNSILAKSDPYCILRVGRKHDFPMQGIMGTHYKTTVINNNQDPVWNQSFSLSVSNSEAELLRIQVYDEDPGFGKLNDDLIGMQTNTLLPSLSLYQSAIIHPSILQYLYKSQERLIFHCSLYETAKQKTSGTS